MSLLRQAERCIANHTVHLSRNAFLSAPDFPAVRKGVRDADTRAANGQPKSPIDGRLIAIKDNICTQEDRTTCGSRVLADFRSPYTATVVEKLQEAGALPFGKTNLDEFGMGSHSTLSAYGTINGWSDSNDGALSPGGSSGGSGVAVATGQCWAALGTDTGGSVRLPASYNGIVGFKPSYGLISRHGVVAYANSLDTVGILASNVQSAMDVYEAVRGYDPKDPTSISEAARAEVSKRLHGRQQREGLRVGIAHEYSINELEPSVRDAWASVVGKMQDLGHEIFQVSLPSIKRSLSAYYVLAAAEASSNLAKYDGVRYGTPVESERPSESVLYSQTRGDHLGPEVKRRVLLGSYSLSATAIDNYFIQAQKIRRLLSNDFDKAFALPHPLRDTRFNTGGGGVDIIITPTTPSQAPRLDFIDQCSAVDIYRDDSLTVPASLAGLPAMSVPISLGKLPSDTIGMQVIAQYGDDEMIFKAAQVLENLGKA